ncbi:hypothetical protein M514_12823 [Trichuris suis]|uniref:FLYWCH-type domain-containing protein n=1 Tax=Trichuris suis TaxID=68888 RepID=A0A085LMU2_9BILA|nr:hypothetical protein M513_12823 [Trichuris suis]KFD62211.1 hypothetical protein M514_12823 [Trichuris suis]KHJ44686.1 FLYWCH zinc finger domain protein [Trichuris suis]
MASSVSQRNKEKFFHNGYMYTFAQFNHSKKIKFWRCDKRHVFGCIARLHTSADTSEVLKQINDHCHDSDPNTVEVNAYCAAIKRRAEETLEPPDVIIDEEYKNTSPSVRSLLPSKEAMKKVIQRKRASMKARSP